MLEVSERQILSSQVFLILENDLVRVETGIELFEALVDLGRVWLKTFHFLDHLLKYQSGRVRVEVENLDLSCLFEQGLLLEISGDEAGSALVGVFPDQVASDCAGLIEDGVIINDIRSLAEWLMLEVLWKLVLTLEVVDEHHLVRDFLLLAD